MTLRLAFLSCLFATCAIAEAPWNAEKKLVDKAHQDLPKSVHHTAFVNSEGLHHKGDKIHFNAAACRELGKHYAAAYLKMSKE